MTRRNVEVIQCDGCGAKIESVKGEKKLPSNWRRITIGHEKSAIPTVFEFDVHSPGCGERAAIRAIRSIYGMPDRADASGIFELDPVPPVDEVLTVD